MAGTQEHPDLGALSPRMVDWQAYVRLAAYLRDSFTCQIDTTYRPTAKLALFLVVPSSKGGKFHLHNAVTVSNKYKRMLWEVAERNPNVELDLELLKSNTDVWLLDYPDKQAILDRYVKLIEEEHRLARIVYFSLYNKVINKGQTS